jgi:hypothetical protein
MRTTATPRLARLVSPPVLVSRKKKKKKKAGVKI